ncbi:hypothetical protein KI387_002032, partial [Taxus chinensis]
EGQAMEEARRVIAVLFARNVVLMKFASDVHEACSTGIFEGRMLEKLDLPELSAPVVLESEGVIESSQKIRFYL